VNASILNSWRDVSAYLDDVLELEPSERPAWLENLATRDPVAAANVRTCLANLDELEKSNFLGTAPLSALTGTSLEGQQFGAYTLDREIGRGGAGTVWLAHRSDGQFEGEAAVKLLHGAPVADPAARKFVREGSFLARLQHPNVAHLLDAGVAANRHPYLVLEYVRGDRIDRYCDAHSLGVHERIRLFLDVLGAVSHAHSKLIVHRDLKPSNILVTESGIVKLLDFGVASLLSASSENAAPATGQVAPGLTPGFAAPEQLLDEPVTTATDVYALGMVLFVLLAGEHPFKGQGKDQCKDAADLARLTLNDDVPLASASANDPSRARVLRGDLDSILAKALRRRADERYPTVDQFAQDLCHYLAFEPIAARPRSAGYRARMFMRRHRAAIAITFTIAAVLIGAVIVTTQQMFEAQEQRDRTRFQSRRADASREFLEMLMMSDLSASQPARTFQERLEAGVQLLEQQYRDDPKFEGRMLVELGSGFRDNEETARANELYQKAYDIGRMQADVELMAAAQCNRAYAEGRADVAEGVIARLDDAQRLLEQVAQPDADLVAGCFMARSIVEQRLGHIEQSEALLLKAKHVLEADNATHLQTYASILTDLGILYFGRNQPRELLRMSQLAGENLDRNGRGGTSGRLIPRQNAATALFAMGEVRASLEERETINRRLLELSSVDQEPQQVWVNYATVLARMGRPTDALKQLDDVLANVRRTGNTSQLTSTQLARGAALLDLKRLDEAGQALNEASTLASQGIGNKSIAALIESSLAQLDVARGDLASARGHRARAFELAGYRAARPERALAKVLRDGSAIALAEGRTDDAAQWLKDSLAISEGVARGPDTSADVGETLLRMAETLKGVSGDANARTLERAVRCLTNGLGPDHPLTVEARNLVNPPTS
jgi:serine/threonine-protein kinase